MSPEIHPQLPMLVKVVSESDIFSEYMHTLSTLPESLRRNAVDNLLTRMRDGGEDDDTLDLFESLDDNRIFDALIKTLDETIDA